MNRPLTVLVDMDDTIEDLLPAWLHALNQRYDRSVTPQDVHSWDMRKAYPGLSEEQIFEPLFREVFWETVRPRLDAMEYLKKLQDEGYEIYITTSSNYQTIRTKLEAILCRYFPYIRMDHVIVCAKKQMIRGDIMVDDAPHNLENGQYERILVSAPHNMDYDAKAHGMYRVTDWREIYELIHKLS